MASGVSSRTRSKKVPLFHSFSFDSSSSKRRKYDEDVMSFDSVSGSKRRKLKDEAFVFPKRVEVISIDDEDGEGFKKKVKIDDESGGSCEISDKNGSFDDEMCGWDPENPITMDEQFVGSKAVRKKVKVDVRKKVKVDGSAEFVDKDGKFVDEECGWEPDNPITFDEDDEQFVGSEADDEGGDVRKKAKVDGNRGSGEFVDKDEFFDDFDFDDYSDESEENDTSDEDFYVGMKEISENDDDSSSDSSFADDVDEEEEEEEEEEEKKKKKGSTKYFNVVEELARKVNDEQSGDEEEEEEEEEKKKEEEEEVEKVEKNCLRKPNNVVVEVKEEVREEEKEEEKVNEIFDIEDGSSNDVVDDEEVEKNGLRKLNNVVEEVEEEVREEEKVNETCVSDDVSSNDVIVDDNEEKVRDEEETVLMEEDKEEVREEVDKEKKEKVIEICDSDHVSSNDVIVDDSVEKVKDEEKKGLMEEDKEEVREEVEKEKVNEICDSDHVSSNDVIVDDNVEMVRDDEKKGLTKPNNVVEEDKEEIMEEDKGLKKLNNVVEEDEEEAMEKLWKECNNGLMEEEELLREMEDQKSGTSKRNNQKKKIKISPTENVNVGDSVKGNEQHVKGLGVGGVSSDQIKQEKMKDLKKFKISPSGYNNEVEHSDYGSATASTTINPMKGCSPSKLNEASETQKAKNVEMKVENVSHDDVNVAKFKAKYSAKRVKRLMVVGLSAVQTKQLKVKVGDSVKGKEHHVKGSGVGGVSSVQIKQERVDDLDKQEIMEDKPREDYKGRTNIQNGVKKESTDNDGLNQRVRSKPSKPNKLPLAQYLAELYQSNKEATMKNESNVLKMNDDGLDQKDTQKPPVCAETPSLIWSLKRVVPKTKEEEELEKELEKNKPLWDEMERALRESEAESEIGNLGTNRSPSPQCEHITLLDEQLGVYCKVCGDVITEIKYITELVEDRYPNEGSRRRASIGGDDVSLFDRSHLNVSDDDSKDNVSHTEVTVWDKIPGVKQTLYPHQQEGFEFIWKNLAGSIELQKLKNADPRSEGGCIISHAPGTGKTRLTIVFLKAYLKLFPKCLPIVVAPASLLLTWEEEFKKWDIGVPFHNLSNVELSGKEHADAVNKFDRFSTRLRADETRMAKLISWFKETSILGMSYNLYGSICQHKKEEKLESVKETKGNFDMRDVLLEAPGLLVLDEGHTPRNQRSHIWKVLKKSQTPKRIILSGTPFQNNFSELYGTLSLVKPSFPTMIPPELKTFCHKQVQKSSKKWGWEAYSSNIKRDSSDDDKIKKLKLLMDPFVHVHKGAILESKLPGLRECLVTLKADSFQNDILKSIKRSRNSIFNFERKIALASVHPSLFLKCHLSKEEESLLDKDKIKQLRMNPHEGVKTKFVYEFVRLCDASNEKVLIFSQFHAPLQLIQDQLNSAFNWSNGEVLFMSSHDSTKDKQSIIHSFNDENSKAKVLLAATKACSEGISLVGASRVVLLDVVWNPSVERQAISRAYRIGQKKVVYTYHLLAEGTSEAEKYGKQAEKDRLSELLFSAKNATDNDVSKRRAVNFEDEVLDKMTRHEKLIDMFVKCVVLRKERDLV